MTCFRLYRRVFDIGRFKVVWVNYQIMATVAWNVQIPWPEPFRTFEVRSHITCWYSLTHKDGRSPQLSVTIWRVPHLSERSSGFFRFLTCRCFGLCRLDVSYHVSSL